MLLVDWLCSLLVGKQSRAVDEEVESAARAAAAARNDHHLLAEMICDEVTQRARELDDKQEAQRRSQLSMRAGGADYSWLAERRPSPLGPPLLIDENSAARRQLGQVEKLCALVEPTEWRRVVGHFRARARHCEHSFQVLDAFREVVNETVDSRPRDHSLGRTVRRYLRMAGSINRICQAPSPSVNELELDDLRSVATAADPPPPRPAARMSEIV